MHYQNLCSGKFLWAYFLQLTISHCNKISYMALNKTFNVFHVSIKTIPRKAKHFNKMESLELSTRFVTDSEHKKSINQIFNLVSRDYFYAKIYLSFNPIKNRTLQIINPLYLSTLTTLHNIP